MATTFETFYDAFKDLSVTGVTSLDEPPLSAPSAKIPCKWVDSIKVEGAPFRAKALGGWPEFSCRVVVLMEPIGRNRNENRWSDAIDMMDTLNDALVGMDNPCKSNLSWSITCQPDFVDQYFAVVATVKGEG